jgi:putative inorganic carbon (hco3(-)) transporter
MNREGRFSQGLVVRLGRGLGLLGAVLASAVAGVAAAASPRASFWLFGLVGIAGYAVLAYFRSFAAFILFVLLSLTVWLSGIKVVGGISVLVGLGLVFTVVWLWRLASSSGVFVKVKEYRLLLAMLAVLAISTLLNLNGPAGLAPVLTYLQLFILFVLVVNLATTPSRLHALGGAIIVASTLLAVLILLDQAGWLPAGLVGDSAAGVEVGSSLEIITRAGGLWGDANFSAMQLTMALPFIIEWWLMLRSWRARALLLMAGGAILMALTFTFSTGGLLGLSIILLLKAIGVTRRNILLAILRISFLVVIALWASSVILPDLYLARVLAKLTDSWDAIRTLNPDLLLIAGSHRGDTWQAAAHVIMDSPVFGHSPGNGRYAAVGYSFFYGTQETLGAHNMFLTVAEDLGIVGLGFFVALLVSAIYAVRPLTYLRTGDSVLRRNGEALFIALIAFSVQGLAIDIHSQKLLWVLMGMAIACRQLCTADRAAASGSGVRR